MTRLPESFWKNLSSRFGIFISWLMVALLSISPGLILTWDWNPSGEEAWMERQTLDKWNKNQDSLSERLFQASSQEFWCRESAIKFKNHVQALITKSFAPGDALLKAQNLFGSTFKTLNPEVIHFVRAGGDWQISSTLKMGSNYFLRQLFGQMVHHSSHGRSELTGNSWEQRIKTLFGKMAYSEIFMPECRLKPVPVIFQGRSYFLAWDLLSGTDNDDVAAGFFLLIPTEFSRNSDLAGRIIANWPLVNDSLSGSGDCWPAFCNFQATDSFAPILHECIDNATDRKLIQEFFFNNFATAGGIKGALDLPVEKIGRAFKLGKRVARLCYSDSVSGFAAMLVADMPSVPVSPRLLVAEWYLKIIVIIWFLFGIRAAIFGRLPTIGITVRVLLWFLAFAAFPAGLTIGSQTATMQDFRDVKVNNLHRDMHQLILHLEAEMAEVSDKFLKAAINVWSDQKLAMRTYELPKSPELDKEYLNDVRDSFKRNRIEPAALILVVQGGWCFSLFSDDSPLQFQKSCRTLFGSVFDRYLKQSDPTLYEKNLPKVKASDPERRASSISSATDFSVHENLALAREKFESVSEFFPGNNYALSYTHQLNLGLKPFAVFVALFKPEKMYADALKIRLPERAFAYRRNSGISPDIGVYKTSGAGVELVLSTGRTEGLDRITRLPVERTAYLYDKDYASIMVPSQRMPGFVFVARLSAFEIESQVLFEKFSMLGSLALLMLVVLTGSGLASFWVGKPLRDFVPDLEAIRSGRDITTGAVWRDDEISSTGHSIRRMSDWVKEREKIRKFVSPQAISQVLASNFIKAGAGTIRKAIVLVSDIRSFTTISEEYPAEEVFDMVNTHLGTMSEIIEKFGGVIDRFVGDAVWAVFYEDDQPMAKSAISAAVEMNQRHAINQQQRAAAGKFTVRIGTGLARGEILAGIMGNSGVRLDYTAAGKTLQEAEDAEAASKMGRHTSIVVTRNLKEALPDTLFEEIGGSSNLFEVVKFAAK